MLGFTSTKSSALTIVTALFNGIGVTVGLNLRIKVTIGRGTGKIIKNLEVDNTILNHILMKENIVPSNYDIEVVSEIPPAVGLKSSSAFSLAMLDAIYKMKNVKIDPIDLIKKSCRFSIESGISYTGAMDDAVASYFGGLNIVDNYNYIIIERYKLVPQNALIFIPQVKKIKLDKESFKKFRKKGMKALHKAERLELREAALINSMSICEAFGYDCSVISDILKFGEVKIAGYTGTGPAIYAIVSRLTDDLETYFNSFGKAIKGLVI